MFERLLDRCLNHKKNIKSPYQTSKDIYILLTKHEGRTGRISARGLDSTDRAACKKDQGPIFSQYGPEQAWLEIYYTTEIV